MDRKPPFRKQEIPGKRSSWYGTWALKIRKITGKEITQSRFARHVERVFKMQ